MTNPSFVMEDREEEEREEEEKSTIVVFLSEINSKSLLLRQVEQTPGGWGASCMVVVQNLAHTYLDTT